MVRALFLDRDGVINIDHGYVLRPEDFKLVPGVVDLLRTAQAHNFSLIVVTNQSGLARGLFDESQYLRLENHMREILADEGVTLADIYYCPHHPGGSVARFASVCSCRKPAPGLILQAAREHTVDLDASILIGDKSSDIEAAKAAGVGRYFLVDVNAPHQSFAEIRVAIENS